uniref:Uncharacterized protein n=1 Tax=Cannabis sativa TaxID=3483 RepID=A0A803R646_CANSA
MEADVWYPEATLIPSIIVAILAMARDVTRRPLRLILRGYWFSFIKHDSRTPRRRFDVKNRSFKAPNKNCHFWLHD